MFVLIAFDEAEQREIRVPHWLRAIGRLKAGVSADDARRDLETLLDRLRRHFDWVLIDSPPLASVTDALLLARHADIVVYVIQQNRVDKRLIKQTIKNLRKVTPNLLGAVFNAVDVKATAGAYGYYSSYTPEGDVTKAAVRPSSADVPDSVIPGLLGAWRKKSDPPA